MGERKGGMAMAQLTSRTHTYGQKDDSSVRAARVRKFLRERSSVQKGIACALILILCAVVMRMCTSYAGSIPSSGVLQEKASQSSLSRSSTRISSEDTNSDRAERTQTENENSNALNSSDNEDDTQMAHNVIVVDVVGCVKSQGIVKLSPQACRVDDAIRAAGGITDEADTNVINRAQILEDGQKLYIPKKGERIAQIEDDEAGSNVETSANSDTGVSQSEEAKGLSKSRDNRRSTRRKSKASSHHKVSINLATTDELQTITGIGPAMAKRIVHERKAHGRFKKLDELMRVRGIGKKKFAKIKPYITL